MFKGIKNGWDILKESIKVFNHHPKFIIPLIITWLIYTPIILYLKFWFDGDTLSTIQILGIVFGVCLVFAFILSYSCSMLLEMIQQLESGEKVSIFKSFESTLKQNFLKILPLVLVWAIIWFILTVLQALFSRKKKDGEEDEQFSAQNAAETLAGYQSFSLTRAFFESMNKGVRMIMFLILPAIAWENLSFIQATKKGIAVFRAHLSEFVTGFVLTEAVAALIFLPPALLFYISGKMEISFPDFVWYITIIYVAFAWSYSIYLEQMFMAELYLWNMKWEKEIARARQEGRALPEMKDVPRPSVLDDVQELLEKTPAFKNISSKS